MQVPQTTFFQVTINPYQLWLIIEGIQSQIANQQKKIVEISNLAGGLQTILTQKVKKQQKQIFLELQTIQKKSKECFTQLKSQFKDKDLKYEKKMSQFQSNINILNLKLQNLQNQLRDQFALKLSYFEKKIIGYQILQQGSKESLNSIQSLNQSLSVNYQQLQCKINLQARNNQQFRTSLQQKLVFLDDQVQKQKQTVQKAISLNKAKGYSRQKQKLKTQNDINHQQRVFEVRFAQKAEGNSEIDSMIIKKKKQEANKYEQRKPKEMLRLLALKIQTINQLVNLKFPEIQQKVQRYTIKADVVSQQVDILNRRLEKEKAQFSVLSQQIKLYQDKRNSQKTIENMKNTLGQISKQLNDGFEKKMDKQTFEKYQKYFNDKLTFLVQTSLEKADKIQVKKGLCFLEDRLKELIIVIAEQRNLNKDSAVKKIAPKCLSCDKQLQTMPQNAKKQLRTSFNLQARVSTPSLRKKYKNRNVTTADEER